MAPSVDHVGFFSADVDGAILVASLLCEPWIQRDELPSLVFGVPEGPYLQRTSETGLSHFRQTCDRLRDGGCEIRPVDMFLDFGEIVTRHTTLVAGEAAIVHREWYEAYSDLYQEKTAELIRNGRTVNSALLAACRAGRDSLRVEIVDKMKSNGFSAFLAPSTVGPAPRDLGSTGDPVMNLPWTHAGLPAMSIPSGRSDKGLPMGLQLVGSWMDDEKLMKVARRIDEILNASPP
jgi:Asp-tRNA(Asn)/Glu-tRNA(Gln) amidotransferase A subunit family amidase